MNLVTFVRLYVLNLTIIGSLVDTVSSCIEVIAYLLGQLDMTVDML